jgi:uncharacterized Tic20 family protein
VSLQLTEMPSRRERWLAVLGHFGVPFYGPLLPLVVWALAGRSNFLRAHASQAFSFQCLFLIIYLPTMILVVTKTVSLFVLPVLILAALVAEVLNAIRALRGESVIRVVPIRLLRAE